MKHTNMKHMMLSTVLIASFTLAACSADKGGGAAPVEQQKPAGTETTTETTTTANPANTDMISEQDAKAIALKDAGLKEEEVVFIKFHLDREHGRTEYEIEFVKDNKEYDYDIDALTGEITSRDYEIDDRAALQSVLQQTNGTAISQQEALATALKDAGLSEAEVQYPHVELDYDDGRQVYEVKFYQGQMEYSYDIDAANGQILSFEKEIDD